MRAAAEVRMIGDEGIAFGNFGARVALQYPRRASGKSTHVERQHDMLSDDFALRIQNGATRVLRFTNDRGVAGAK